MPYQDINRNRISPAQNPYMGAGSAASVADEQDNRVCIVQTRSIKSLLTGVRRTLDLNRSIRLFFVGDYGYGKTTHLNLVVKEVRSQNGICIPIQFQRLPLKTSNDPEEDLLRLQGAILAKISSVLDKERLVSKEDTKKILDESSYVDLIEAIYEMLNKTHKTKILLTFDEIEILFSKLRIDIPDFMSFLHSLSEKMFIRPGWGICASITQREYYTKIIEEAGQLQYGRFDFHIIEPLSPLEVREYIEEKNSILTNRVKNREYPFDTEVIDFIAVVSGGIPRYIETVCELIWSEAEAGQAPEQLIELETARRIFSNKYLSRANQYFADLCRSFALSHEAEAFLKLLFYSGGRRRSVQDLLVLTDSSPISYFHGLSTAQSKYRLNQAGQELRDSEALTTSLEVFGKRPARYTIKDLVFKSIFDFS
jgi:hypothetical protein